MAKFAGIEKPIEVLTIEDAFFQDRDGYATVLLKIGDGTNHFHDAHKDHDADSKPKINQSKNQRKNENRVEEEIIGQGPENALLVLHGVIVGRDYRFFVDQIRYPYVPKEFKYVPVKAKDDGHGHDH